MNLINFLKENKYTRKVFGERELKIIEKQLLGINLTQSEKNRLSRDIRKKFEFIKEVIRFSKDFELKKGSIIKEYIEEAKEFILNDILYKKITNTKGVPQGLPISNILASIYLLEFDKIYKTNTCISYFRYVDDILIFTSNKNKKKIKESIEDNIENKFLLELNAVKNDLG